MFAVEFEMALIFMPRSQLSRLSFCPMAEAMWATSWALATISPRSTRTRCTLPIPTKERLINIRQKNTSTAIAVKLRR